VNIYKGVEQQNNTTSKKNECVAKWEKADLAHFPREKMKKNRRVWECRLRIWHGKDGTNSGLQYYTST
jgi:hypothetical protein